MEKVDIQISETRIAKFFTPLIDFDGASGIPAGNSPFAELLQEARRIAGGSPEAAVAWLTHGQPAFAAQRLKISELTQPAHALMLHALLNALPIADISSDQPNVINDTSSRPDFENVCPVRFLAIFPIASEWIQTVGYLVLYDVKPAVLQLAAYSALTALARDIAAVNP